MKRLTTLAIFVFLAVAVTATAADPAANRRPIPGNGTHELSTQPPAAGVYFDSSTAQPNLADRLRAIRPEMILVLFVGALLLIAVVLAIGMLRQVFRGGPARS
jgi:hypothetical protein